MDKDVVIVIADDDPGHVTLMIKNLKRSGITNDIIHFGDGGAMLEFLFGDGDGPHREPGISYIFLLDIRMPKVSGIEVLKRIKDNEETRKTPTLMITTTDDPREVENCYDLGCNGYIIKPIQYDNFTEAIRQLGLYLKIVEMP